MLLTYTFLSIKYLYLFYEVEVSGLNLGSLIKSLFIFSDFNCCIRPCFLLSSSNCLSYKFCCFLALNYDFSFLTWKRLLLTWLANLYVWAMVFLSCSNMLTCLLKVRRKWSPYSRVTQSLLAVLSFLASFLGTFALWAKSAVLSKRWPSDFCVWLKVDFEN